MLFLGALQCPSWSRHSSKVNGTLQFTRRVPSHALGSRLLFSSAPTTYVHQDDQGSLLTCPSRTAPRLAGQTQRPAPGSPRQVALYSSPCPSHPGAARQHTRPVHTPVNEIQVDDSCCRCYRVSFFRFSKVISRPCLKHMSRGCLYVLAADYYVIKSRLVHHACRLFLQMFTARP